MKNIKKIVLILYMFTFLLGLSSLFNNTKASDTDPCEPFNNGNCWNYQLVGECCVFKPDVCPTYCF